MCFHFEGKGEMNQYFLFHFFHVRPTSFSLIFYDYLSLSFIFNNGDPKSFRTSYSLIWLSGC